MDIVQIDQHNKNVTVTTVGIMLVIDQKEVWNQEYLLTYFILNVFEKNNKK